MFGRQKRDHEPGVIDGTEQADQAAARQSSDDTLTNNNSPPGSGYFGQPSKEQVKRATRTRFVWCLIASLLLLISLVFVILVEIGQTRADNKILNRIYFININLSDIIPVSVPDYNIINSIAQTLGLHDYYRVGLWNFCEGNNGVGITDCSKPETLYWFDPVSIIKNQLLSGATVALPQEINTILNLIKTVSHWMFGLFMAGACLTFVMIFLQPISVLTRWAALPIMILTFFAALFTTVASVIATVLFIIMQNAITSATSLNIEASIGVEMFAFMWVASATAIMAWLIQLCLTCCCATRRDVRKGKKRGSKKAWRDSETPGVSEKEPSQKQGWFGRKK